MRLAFVPRDPSSFPSPPSHAEIAALLPRLLPDQDPDCQLVELEGGAFNSTFRVEMPDGRRSILRVSPPADSPRLFGNERHLLRREHALGPFLAALGGRLPRVLAADFTQIALPRDAILSQFIAGDNWDAVKDTLTPAENDTLWRQLAHLLRDLHATPAPAFGWPPPGQSFPTWSQWVAHAAALLHADAVRLGLPTEEATAWRSALEAGSHFLDEIRQPRVVHGDPWPKNVLISGRGAEIRITGLIDHERGLWGDPLNEWVFHKLDFPPVFWEAYGPPPPDPGTRFRTLCYGGLIDLQILLEGWRYRFDATFAREALAKTAAAMRELVASHR